MRVLDLFSGLGGWTHAFVERGHDVRTLDNEPRFKPTYCMDIRTLASDPRGVLEGWQPDVILASPDCSGWTTLGNAWKRVGPRKSPTRIPASPKAHEAVQLVQATLNVIQELRPWAWWMENPVGGLRKHALTQNLRRVTVDYCRYGQAYRKPTDLFGCFAPAWRPRPRCIHERHESSVLDLSDSARRSLIPYELSLDVALACEAGPNALSTAEPIRLGQPIDHDTLDRG